MSDLLFVLIFITFLSFFHLGTCIVFNVTVSSDGKADFKRVMDAVASAPNNSNSRFYIHVKPGVYNEHVVIQPTKTFIALIGDDASTTVIVDNRSNRTGFGTSDSATFTVQGRNFMARSITFKNDAGPSNGQGVALLDEADQTAYYRCKFLGFQDTLYAREGLTFFKECEIYGTVDFIFGEALAVFQDCKLYGRLPKTIITITAQSKESDDQKSGFSFHNCMVTASPEVVLEKSDVVVFLGRPWRDRSTVVFMESFLDTVVDPRGWLEWGQTAPVNLLFYAEFNNTGPGANISERIKWAGYHVLQSQAEANSFTVEKFINGNQWLPETGVPFKPGF